MNTPAAGRCARHSTSWILISGGLEKSLVRRHGDVVCRSRIEPGGPRRCPSHSRSKIQEAVAEVVTLVERQAGIARLIGSAKGITHEGDRVVSWMGQADLYELAPPLNGYTMAVASTVDRVPAVQARGTEWNIETFLFGVTGERLEVDWDELPGSAWGATAIEALRAAGYQVADSAAAGT